MMTTTTLTESTAHYDIYRGLRVTGFTWIGAIRIMRSAGISLADAKRAHDLYEANS